MPYKNDLSRLIKSGNGMVIVDTRGPELMNYLKGKLSDSRTMPWVLLT